MAKIKSPTPKLRLAHWSIIFLALLFITAGIYAMTTWNDTNTDVQSLKESQKEFNDSLKVNSGPSSAGDLNNNPAPAQTAATTEGGQNMQPSASTPPGTNYNYNYPVNPKLCPPGSQEIVCAQY